MSAGTKRFTVSRRNGCLVLQYGMKAVRIFERDESLNLILPVMPKPDETITFEIKKVEKNA